MLKCNINDEGITFCKEILSFVIIIVYSDRNFEVHLECLNFTILEFQKEVVG